MEHTLCWGPHFHWFWIIPFLFMVLMFGACFRMLWRTGNWRWRSGHRARWQPFWCYDLGQEPPDQILDRRYASGEITKEQYEQMKRDIQLSQK